MFHLPFVRIVSLLLHNLQNSLTGVCAIFRIAVNSNGFLQRTNIVFSVDINSGSGLLRNLPYRRSLSPDYSSYLKNARKSAVTTTTSRALFPPTISLCTSILNGKSVCRLVPGRPPKGAPGPLAFLRPFLSPANSTLMALPSNSKPLS